MTTYTFTPKSSTVVVNWDDPTVWTGGVAPNAPDADVVFPTVTTTATGQIYGSDVYIQASENYAVRSVSLTNNYLVINGALTVSGAFNEQTGGAVVLNGGSLSVGTLLNGPAGGPQDGSTGLAGYGQVTSAGLVTNNSSIFGGGGGNLTATFAALVNNGTLQASGATLTVNVANGGFSNLSGGTLTGGAYIAGNPNAPTVPSTLSLNVGGVVTTDAAAITLHPDAQIQFYNPTAAAYVPLQTSLRDIASGGSLTLDDYAFTTSQLTVDGALTLEAAVFNSTAAMAVLTAGQLTVDAGGAVSGVGKIVGPIANAGSMTAAAVSSGASALDLTGPITGSGVLDIAGGIAPSRSNFNGTAATLELGGATSQTVQFANGIGTLQLDSPLSFTGTIAPVGAGDQIILSNLSMSAVTGYSYTPGGAGGTLTIQDGGTPITLKLSGYYNTSSFTLAAGPQPLSTSPPSVEITVGAQVAAPPTPTLQQLDTYYSDIMRVAVSAIPSGDATTLSNLATQVDAGTLTLAAADTQVAKLAVNTTSVANMAYQFFTGLTPYESGLDYLVSPTGPNPNNLNSAYYQNFNVVNRFIDFAVNLGVLGQGATQFSAAYGSLSMSDAVTQAYTTIFGTAPAASLVSSILNDSVPNGLGGTETRQQYFAYYGGDGPSGIGTKAAMVGWLLSVAATGDTGVYAKAEDAFLADLAPDGVAHFYTNLVGTYGAQPTGSPGATISFNHDQSVSLTAPNPALQSTNNNDTITGTGGLDAGQSVATGNGNDTLTIPSVVYGTVQMGNGNDTLTFGGLGATTATLGVPAQAGAVTLGGGNDTVYLNGSMAAGTSLIATGSDNALYLAGTASGGTPTGTVSGFQTVYVQTPTAEQTVTFTNGLQTVYDTVASGSSTATVGLSGPDGTVFVLQNTSNGVAIIYPSWTVTTTPAGALVRSTAAAATAEIHLNHYAGAPTVHISGTSGTGPVTADGGSIIIAGGDQTSVLLHVDSDSTAGLIAAYDTGETGSVVFEMPAFSPIPNLTIAGVGALTAQIDGGFTTVDASAAANLNLTYTAQNQGSTVLFSNGTDALNLTLQTSGPTNATASASKFVFGSGVDTVNLTTFDNLTTTGQTVNAPAEIDGFVKGVDHLNLNAGSSGLSANVQQYATGATSLTQALIAVSAHVAANTAAVFEYGGDTYVYQQDSVVGVDTGDGLIRLVGVTGLSIATGAATGDIHYG